MKRWRKLGIIAGGGALPLRITAASNARGEAFHVIPLAGYADALLDAFPGDGCGIGEAGKAIRILKEQGCDAVVFAGKVTRPDFKALKVDWRGAAILPKIIAAAARGDGAMLDVMVETMESEGFRVIGAEEALNDLLAPVGAVGAVLPDDQDLEDIKKAAQVIEALGPYDVGQGAVVASGLVIAIEAAEGTDEMISRCASITLAAGEAPSGVLVKRPKPGQELRIDLPTIGTETVRRAVAAGLKGIAVKAGGALIIDRDDVAALADEASLFVYGFTDFEVSEP